MLVKSTPTIRREMKARGYEGTAGQQEARRRAMYDALKAQRFAYSTFATVTFPWAISEADAVVAIGKCLRVLGSLNGGPFRHFYELSLDRKHWYSATAADYLGDTQLVAHWHVHLLLGGLRSTLTRADIRRALRHGHWGHVDVKEYDHSEALSSYLASDLKGNLLGRLQGTNDRTIRDKLARAGEIV